MVTKPTTFLFSLLVISGLFFASAPVRAAEQTSEHCIVGLFSPDRMVDLQKAMADIPEMHLVKVDYETARVTLRYDLKTLFPAMNPKKPPKEKEIEEHLSHLLADASNDTFVLKPCSKIPREKLTKLEIKVGLLDCKGCRYGAYLALLKLDGVQQATVVDKLVTAWIDPAATNQATIEAALKKTGVGVGEK